MFDKYFIGKKQDDFIEEDIDNLTDEELSVVIDDFAETSNLSEEEINILKEIKKQLKDADKNVDKMIKHEKDETSDEEEFENNNEIKSQYGEEEIFKELSEEPIGIKEAKEIIDLGLPVYFDNETSTFYATKPLGLDVIKIEDFELLKEIVEQVEEGVYASKKFEGKKMTDEAQEFISKKIEYLMEEEGMPQDQAIAVAYSYAKEEGYDVPEKKEAKASEDDKKTDNIVANFEPKAQKFEGDKKNGFSVLIADKNSSFETWVDVWIDEKSQDVLTEWNQYIFEDINEKDMSQKEMQEKDKIADMAWSEAVNFLQDKGIIIQDDNANWFWQNGEVSSKEEIVNSNTKASKKVKAADQYLKEDKDVNFNKEKNNDFNPKIKPEQAGDYVPYRDTFDDPIKANKKTEELISKGYENIKITRYTNIEGEKKNFWWEVIAQLPKTPEMTETKKDKGKKDYTNMGTGDKIMVEKDNKKVKAKQKKKEINAEEEKAKLKAINELIEQQEKLFDVFYNNKQINKDDVKKDIELITSKIEDIKNGKIKVKAEPQETTYPEPKPEELEKEKNKNEENNESEEKNINKNENSGAMSLVEGLFIGDGYTIYKDKQSGDIYVIDKEGNEVMRNPNAFVDDIDKIVEFYQNILNVEPEEKEEEKEEKKEEDINIEPEEKEEETIEDTLEDIKKKVNELVNLEKEEIDPQETENSEGGEEEEEEDKNEKNNEELAKLKKEMENKKEEVEKVLTNLNKHKMIVVSRDDIRKHIIAGENPIFAKKKAKEEKIQKLAKRLWAMDKETIKTLEDTLIDKNQKISNKMSSVFQLLDE